MNKKNHKEHRGNKCVKSYPNGFGGVLLEILSLLIVTGGFLLMILAHDDFYGGILIVMGGICALLGVLFFGWNYE